MLLWSIRSLHSLLAERITFSIFADTAQLVSAVKWGTNGNNVCMLSWQYTWCIVALYWRESPCHLRFPQYTSGPLPHRIQPALAMYWGGGGGDIIFTAYTRDLIRWLNSCYSSYVPLCLAGACAFFPLKTITKFSAFLTWFGGRIFADFRIHKHTC